MSSDEQERRDTVTYQVHVSPDVKTPVEAGTYTVQIAEGGIYRSRATYRVYTVREINPATDTMRYEYTRGDAAEPVEREGRPSDLAVVDGIRGCPGGVVGVEPSAIPGRPRCSCGEAELVFPPGDTEFEYGLCPECDMTFEPSWKDHETEGTGV